MTEFDDTTATFTGWITQLARDHTSALARLARAEGLLAEDALDAVQEAFETMLRLPQARSLVGAKEDSRLLLGAIVRNAARNMRRRHHRARPHVEFTEAALAEGAEPTVEALIQRAEAHARAQGCVDRLGEIQRRVVVLRMLDEVSGTAAAAELDLQPGHVAVLLHRARQALLRCMADESM